MYNSSSKVSEPKQRLPIRPERVRNTYILHRPKLLSDPENDSYLIFLQMGESRVLAKIGLGKISDAKKTTKPCPGQHLQSQCTGYVTGMIRYIAGNQEAERGSENKATTHEFLRRQEPGIRRIFSGYLSIIRHASHVQRRRDVFFSFGGYVLQSLPRPPLATVLIMSGPPLMSLLRMSQKTSFRTGEGSKISRSWVWMQVCLVQGSKDQWQAARICWRSYAGHSYH